MGGVGEVLCQRRVANCDGGMSTALLLRRFPMKMASPGIVGENL